MFDRAQSFMTGQVKLRGMGQRNIAMTSFIAPQVGPSMTPGFLFATDQGTQPSAPLPTPAPVPPAPAPAAAPAAPPAPAAPTASDGKALLGPLVVLAVVAGIVAWKA